MMGHHLCLDHEEELPPCFRKKELRAVHLHCYGHSLDLACSEEV